VGSPGSLKRSGIPPAEYENIDFETRLASYSDEELNNGGRPMTQQEKRRSKDDAWVDILVAGGSRRFAGQDAELRSGMRLPKAGRSDPELASQEVAQALAAVKGHPPSDDEDEVVMEPIREPSRTFFDDESVTGPEPPSKMSEDSETTTSPAQKPRLTYFDLHPERRPVRGTDSEDDPRARIANEDSESEDHCPKLQSTEFTTDLDFESTFDHLSVGIDDFRGQERTTRAGGHSKADSMTLPTIMLNAGEAAATPESPSETNTRSKTAALIEMYREKERAGNSPQPGQRTRALPLIPSQASPGRTPPRTPSPHGSEEEDPLSKYDQSPSGSGRYVHGAPLQNVVEEEEM